MLRSKSSKTDVMCAQSRAEHPIVNGLTFLHFAHDFKAFVAGDQNFVNVHKALIN